MSLRARILRLVLIGGQADRVVPPTGFTARLTVLAAAAMAFLAVFALALSLAAGRLAESWSTALSNAATIRISAPADQLDEQVQRVLAVLAQTPGIKSYRLLSEKDTQALLEPWFGPDLPLDALPVPRLIEIVPAPEGFDRAGLAARLAGEAPGAVLDDHAAWRAPLARAAERLRWLALLSLGLIGATTAAVITLAASAALAANAGVIRVLRLVGARDDYIARAFVRRYTLRTLAGATLGTALGMGAVALLPADAQTSGTLLTDLGFHGWQWLLPLAIIPLAGLVGLVATRATAMATLRKSR